MTHALLTVFHPLAYYLSFFVFGLLGLALSVGCLLLAWLPATPRVEHFCQRLVHRHCALWLGWLAFTRLVRVRFEGFDRLSGDRGLVLVANHLGLMDVLYLFARVPEALCIFKPAVRRNPVLGAAVRRAGYLCSDGGHDLVRLAAERVAAGATLIIFPEGTRARAGVLNPLKPGFVLIARRAHAPVQLVRIACDSNLLVKGRAWWKLPGLPAHVTVSLGPCLPPPDREKNSAIIAQVDTWFRSGPAADTADRWPAAGAASAHPQPAS